MENKLLMNESQPIPTLVQRQHFFQKQDETEQDLEKMFSIIWPEIST